MSRFPIGAAFLAAVLTSGFSLPAMGQDEEPVADAESRECVSLRMIRRTKIVDDRNILFYMRGGDVYHNILPRICSGLKREDRFGYETSHGSLCRMDTIRVLYNDAIGLRQGNACGLGQFHKITEEDAEAILEGPDSPTEEAPPLPMPEPGEVDDRDEEADEPR